MGEDKNLCNYFIFVQRHILQIHTICKKNKQSALFSDTLGVFIRSIQEIELTNIKIKHVID